MASPISEYGINPSFRLRLSSYTINNKFQYCETGYIKEVKICHHVVRKGEITLTSEERIWKFHIKVQTFCGDLQAPEL